MAQIDKELSSYHLANTSARTGQMAVGNFFKFIVHDMDRLLRPGIDEEIADDDDYITNAQEALNLSIESIGDLHFDLADKEVRTGNSVWTFAGVPTFKQTEIKVRDYVGLDGKSVLEAWQQLAYNPVTDKQGDPYDYKKDCTVIEYTGDGTRRRSWTLYGCWVKSVSESGYDRTTAGDTVRIVSATIRYDKAIQDTERTY